MMVENHILSILVPFSSELGSNSLSFTVGHWWVTRQPTGGAPLLRLPNTWAMHPIVVGRQRSNRFPPFAPVPPVSSFSLVPFAFFCSFFSVFLFPLFQCTY